MTTPLLSPGGKRRAEREERNCRKEARAKKRAEDKRKAKEEQGRRDTERARKEKQEKEQKKQEEQEKQRKEKEQKERENRERLARMTTPEEQHRAAMKKAESDAAALEKARLANLELTNPCLFDKKLKYAITKILHTNLYKKNNPYHNLFESENITSWVEFLDMYQANPLSVYTDEFPYTDKEGNMVTGSDSLAPLG